MSDLDHPSSSSISVETPEDTIEGVGDEIVWASVIGLVLLVGMFHLYRKYMSTDGDHHHPNQPDHDYYANMANAGEFSLRHFF